MFVTSAEVLQLEIIQQMEPIYEEDTSRHHSESVYELDINSFR